MGMYDNVNYADNCCKCGEPLKDFQSKDGPCTLSVLQPAEVEEFHTMCDHCRRWHQYTVRVVPASVVVTLKEEVDE